MRTPCRMRRVSASGPAQGSIVSNVQSMERVKMTAMGLSLPGG